MILPAFHDMSTRKVVLELPHLLDQELEAYRAYYKQTYGADVTESQIVREILRYTLEHDEGFRAFRVEKTPPRAKATRTKPAPLPPPDISKNPPAQESDESLFHPLEPAVSGS